MQFFSSRERKNYIQSRANSQNDNCFLSKQQPRTIFSQNDCPFVSLLWFECLLKTGFFKIFSICEKPCDKKQEDM